MESAVYSLYQVDVRNLVKNRVYITKNIGIQPNEYRDWPFYEYEFLLEDINEYIEEENKRNSEENDTGSFKQDKVMRDMKGMMKNAQSGFKMPSIPKF